MSAPSFEWWQDRAADLHLKMEGGELKGPCPSCGGDDRFHVRKKDGLVGCRGCNDYPAVLKAAGWEFQKGSNGGFTPKAKHPEFDKTLRMVNESDAEAAGIVIKEVADKPDERKSADWFIAQAGMNWQHDTHMGKWRNFDGDCWRERDPEAHALMRKLAPELVRNTVQRGALAQAASVMTRRDWNASPELSVPGGWVDLKSGEHHATPKADLYSTVCTTVAPQAGKPTLWLKTLSQCLAGPDSAALVDYLQRWFGYCLTTDMREQVFSLWIGGGANGKSTVAGTVADILGGYAQGMARQAVVKGTHEPHAAVIAKLEGSRHGSLLRS